MFFDPIGFQAQDGRWGIVSPDSNAVVGTVRVAKFTNYVELWEISTDWQALHPPKYWKLEYLGGLDVSLTERFAKLVKGDADPGLKWYAWMEDVPTQANSTSDLPQVYGTLRAIEQGGVVRGHAFHEDANGAVYHAHHFVQSSFNPKATFSYGDTYCTDDLKTCVDQGGWFDANDLYLKGALSWHAYTHKSS